MNTANGVLRLNILSLGRSDDLLETMHAQPEFLELEGWLPNIGDRALEEQRGVVRASRSDGLKVCIWEGLIPVSGEKNVVDLCEDGVSLLSLLYPVYWFIML
jgi:hypothetical protein